MPQVEQQHQEQQQSRRRRRRRGGLEAGFGQLLPVAAVALCSMTNAFVPQTSWRGSLGPPSLLHQTTSSSALPNTNSQRGAAARGSRMVLGEAPSAACRRALQRAWQASSKEATTHERLEVSRFDLVSTKRKKIFDSTPEPKDAAGLAWGRVDTKSFLYSGLALPVNVSRSTSAVAWLVRHARDAVGVSPYSSGRKNRRFCAYVPLQKKIRVIDGLAIVGVGLHRRLDLL